MGLTVKQRRIINCVGVEIGQHQNPWPILSTDSPLFSDACQRLAMLQPCFCSSPASRRGPIPSTPSCRAGRRRRDRELTQYDVVVACWRHVARFLKSGVIAWTQFASSTNGPLPHKTLLPHCELHFWSTGRGAGNAPQVTVESCPRITLRCLGWGR